MKLESLNTKKFEAFKENELQNAMKIVGGRIQTTGGNTDYFDSSTDGGWTGGDGTTYDRYNKPYIGVEPIG